MKLVLLCVGKLREAWVRDGCADYAKRVAARLPFTEIEARDDDDLVKKIPARLERWVLDERGKQLSSPELAQKLAERMNQGSPGIAFIIGGANGVPPELLKGATFVWSLGRLTLPHRVARLVVTEQLYRGLSIVRGEPYHHA